MMAGVVSTVLLLQLIHAGPTSSLLAADSDRVDELRCWLQVRNLQPVCKYTADVAFAHGLPLIAEARRAVQGGCFQGHTCPDSMDMQGTVMAAIVNCTQGCRLK